MDDRSEESALVHLRFRTRPRVGDQLELLLGGDRVWIEPWDGRAPRGLTKASKMFSLQAPPAGVMWYSERCASEGSSEQLDLSPLVEGSVEDG